MFGNVHFSPDRPDPDNISRMDMNCLPMIHDMHKYGIRLDVPFLKTLSNKIADIQEICEVEVDVYRGSYKYRTAKNAYVSFNIGSRDHLSQFLFEHLKIQQKDVLEMTPAGKRFEVSEEVLEPFRNRHPVVAPIIEWHKVEKLRNTYVDALPYLVDADSRLHTQFNATVAATGRLSSSNPNLQNIPVRTELGKEVRRAFVAAEDCVLVSCDLAQIEMVWAAHRSQDETMLNVFRNAEDIHTRTACNVFGLDYAEIMTLTKLIETGSATPNQINDYKFFKNFQRLPCKTVGFGVLYGQTADGLKDSLAADGVHWTLEQCELFITNDFFAVYPGLLRMLKQDWATVMRYAMIWCDFGRVRLVPEAKSSIKKLQNEGTRKAGNHPEQAGAQGTIKVAMAELIDILRRFNRDYICRPLLQIHDQLIVEAHKLIANDVAGEMSRIICGATPLTTPIRASSDVADNWRDL